MHAVRMTTTAAPPSPATTNRRAGLTIAVLVRATAWDIGLPVAGYYVLAAVGASEWAALMAGSALAGSRVLWGVVRERALNPFAAVMLLVFGLGVALGLVTGDPRFLLAVKSLTTGVVGAWFLVTAWRGRRPLTLAAQQSWAPDAAADLAREYGADPDVRRGHRFCSTVWGLGLVGEALARVVVVAVAPFSVAVGASTVLLVATITGLSVWNGRYLARVEARTGSAAG